MTELEEEIVRYPSSFFDSCGEKSEDVRVCLAEGVRGGVIAMLGQEGEWKW